MKKSILNLGSYGWDHIVTKIQRIIMKKVIKVNIEVDEEFTKKFIERISEIVEKGNINLIASGLK